MTAGRSGDIGANWLARLSVSLAVLALASTLASADPRPGNARIFVDSSGRRVAVPDRIERVYAAGPPAAIMLYTLAPEKLIGWTRDLTIAEKSFMVPRYAELPVLGRLTGRGNTANVEVVLKARPDIIFDYGSLRRTYVSLADRVQEQIGVPYVLMDGAFLNSAHTYRQLGELLGSRQRAEQLASYAERIFAQAATVLRKVPAERRPRVYYARGPDGLETGLGGSINVELLELVGAVNVAAEGAGRGGLASVSIEQVLKWNPEVVLTLDRNFFASVYRSPLWENVDAVKHHRVYLAPTLPFGWFDRPPSVNRLIGVQWLLAVLYPDYADTDLRQATREFYRLFYHLNLSDQQLGELLVDASHGAW
jgi:iron complex transport system substrate-binding protein